MSCEACSVGLYEECTKPAPGPLAGWIFPCGLLEEGVAGAVKRRESRFLAPDELSDDTSAGRKRAAMSAPILNGMECEWSGLKFAGGGVIPIVGCNGTRLANVKKTEDAKALGENHEVGHIHHGPDKSVINNAPGTNLHRICSVCHNRWHALNDEFYGDRPHPSIPFIPTRRYFPHDPTTPALEVDVAVASAWWGLPKAKRAAYPLTPDHLRVLLPMSEPTGSVATANVFDDEIGDSHS